MSQEANYKQKYKDLLQDYIAACGSSIRIVPMNMIRS
jgi:hypothetical protein